MYNLILESTYILEADFANNMIFEWLTCVGVYLTINNSEHISWILGHINQSHKIIFLFAVKQNGNVDPFHQLFWAEQIKLNQNERKCNRYHPHLIKYESNFHKLF